MESTCHMCGNRISTRDGPIGSCFIISVTGASYWLIATQTMQEHVFRMCSIQVRKRVSEHADIFCADIPPNTNMCACGAEAQYAFVRTFAPPDTCACRADAQHAFVRTFTPSTCVRAEQMLNMPVSGSRPEPNMRARRHQTCMRADSPPHQHGPWPVLSKCWIIEISTSHTIVLPYIHLLLFYSKKVSI